MGHINAALEWLIQVFNDMWPLAFATFCGAWMAMQQHKNHEKKKEAKDRRSAIRNAQFALSSQENRLKRLKDALMEQAEQGIGDQPLDGPLDCMRLELGPLVLAFDSDWALLNELADLEQGYCRAMEYVKAWNGTADPHYLKEWYTARVSPPSWEELVGRLDENLARFDEVIPKVDKYVEQECPRRQSGMVDHLAWFALVAAIAACGVFFFSNWAVNGEDMARLGVDISLASAVAFAVSLYVCVGLCSVAAIMIVYALSKKVGSIAVYFWALLVSVQPLVYLLWLEAQ